MTKYMDDHPGGDESMVNSTGQGLVLRLCWLETIYAVVALDPRFYSEHHRVFSHEVITEDSGLVQRVAFFSSLQL